MIELRTLGSLDLRTAEGREVRSVLAQPKRLALLLYLAIEAPGGFVRRDTLLGLFWPESDEARARGALRQAVRYLRRSLGAGALQSRSEDELGIPRERLRCDAVEFRAALEREAHADALQRYRGDLLEGFSVSDAPEFERWLEGERRALRRLARGAAWSLAEEAEADGDRDAAHRWGRQAVALAPYDERGLRRLVSLLDRTGDRAGAVRAYEEFALRLATDLDLEPSPETREELEAVRAREAAMPAEAPGTVKVEGDDADEGLPGTRPLPAPRAPPAPAPVDARVRPRHRRAWGLVGVLLVLGTGGLVVRSLVPASDPALDPRRVVVAPFENRTGDPSFDPVASMTADWILQGLTGQGALEVVPVTAALVSARGGRQGAGTTGAAASPLLDGRPLARETGAGTAITGSFYLQGDSLHFQARVIDAGSGGLLAAIGPVGSPSVAPLTAIDHLRERVLLAVAPLTDERDTHVRMARAPPSYEAYRAYVRGFETFVQWDIRGALRHFEDAASADSTFHLPAIAAAIMHVNLGDPIAADSLARRVNRHRYDLGPLELATLDMLRGWLAGDRNAAWEASVRQARIAPGSIGEFQVAEEARRLNRPSETVQVLTEMGAERGELRGWFPYWRELVTAHHMLEAHADELEAVRQARALYPNVMELLSLEVGTLAALGHVEEVARRVEDRLGSSAREQPDPGQLLRIAALELRAHGHPAAARRAFDRSLDWFRSQPASAASTGMLRRDLATVLYEAGHWDEARDHFLALAESYPEDLVIQGHLGALAARQGDRGEAERVDRWIRELDRPFLWGEGTALRARIAAILGDQDRAVALLRNAFSEGLSHGLDLHRIVDFEELRDHPEYRALMRPGG